MMGNNKPADGTKLAPQAPVILGLVPRIFWQQGTNLVNKLALLLHKCWLREDSWDKPKNDWCRGRRVSAYSQSGRSMIEMLGVLAIIGVLSVGGIAGYSKAMMKWKIDKAIEEYNFLIQGLIEHKDSIAKSYSSGDVALLGDFIVSTNLVPPTWHYTGYFINDSVGNYLKPYLGVASKTIVIDVYFTRTDNPKANEYSYRLCEAMFKDFAYPLASVLNVIFVYNNTYDGTHYWGNSICQTDAADHNICLQDITLTEINQECRKCIEGNNGICGIVFTL